MRGAVTPSGGKPTTQTVTCDAGKHIVGFEKIVSYDIQSTDGVCSFHKGIPKNVRRVVVKGGSKSRKECADYVRANMLTATGATYNGANSECSANLEEPTANIVPEIGHFTCQFYPSIKFSTGAPKKGDGAFSIDACVWAKCYAGKECGGCLLEGQTDWSNEACVRFVRKTYPEATAARIQNIDATKVCSAEFGSHEVDSNMVNDRTHFFTRSGGWHDCGRAGTPSITAYTGELKANYQAVVDTYAPTDMWYNGWPMWRGVKSGYIVYNVARNAKVGPCKSWMTWIIDTPDNTAAKREKCVGIFAGYSTASRFQKDDTFGWKVWDSRPGAYTWIDTRLEMQGARTQKGQVASELRKSTDLKVSCADVYSDIYLWPI